jgi:hypothetical protein
MSWEARMRTKRRIRAATGALIGCTISILLASVLFQPKQGSEAMPLSATTLKRRIESAVPEGVTMREVWYCHGCQIFVVSGPSHIAKSDGRCENCAKHLVRHGLLIDVED